jgi:hypothetical protein
MNVRPAVKRRGGVLLAALAVALAVPVAAAAFTLIELLVVIAIIDEQIGLLVPAQTPADCSGERMAATVTLAGNLETRLVLGRPDGSFDYHIRPVDLRATGSSGVDVRLVGAANGTAAPGEPFTIGLRTIGSSDFGRIDAPTDVTLVLMPKPDDGTAAARVVRIRIRDRCDPDDDSDDDREPPDQSGGDAVLAAAVLWAGASWRRRRRPH